MAKSVSVALGDSDTIASGRFAIVTSPLAAGTVTGKAAVAADVGVSSPLLAGEELSLPQAARVSARSRPLRAARDRRCTGTGSSWLSRRSDRLDREPCRGRTSLP